MGTVSDFARTLTSNGQGTDHAWGGNHFIMGGGVNGGVLWKFPRRPDRGGRDEHWSRPCHSDKRLGVSLERYGRMVRCGARTDGRGSPQPCQLSRQRRLGKEPTLQVI